MIHRLSISLILVFLAALTTSAQTGMRVQGLQLEVPNGAYLKVQNGSLTLDAHAQATFNDSSSVTGDLLIEADSASAGSLVELETLDVGGKAHIERTLLTNHTDSNWQEVTAPVADATAGVFEPGADGNALFEWNENSGDWVQIRSESANVSSLKGYAVASAEARKVTFSGALNTGKLTASLTRTANHAYSGFNLVGNPYPSAIQVQAPAWDNPDLKPSVWYMRNGSYATYNMNLGMGVNGGNSYIPAMQGFWVKLDPSLSSGKMEINNDMRLHYPMDEPDNASTDAFHLIVDNGDVTDQTLLAFADNANEGFDAWDSQKLFADGTFPEIYTYADTVKAAINSMPHFQDSLRVQLGATSQDGETYTIRSAGLEGFDAGVQVFLIDTYLDYELNLRDVNYQFEAAGDAPEPRFVVLLKASATAVPSVENSSKLKAYVHDAEVVVEVPAKSSQYLLEIYNMAGQRVFLKENLNTRQRFRPDLPAGIYSLRITGNQDSMAKKIYLQP